MANILVKYTGIFHVNTASNTVKDDKQFYLEYVSGKLDNKSVVKSDIFNARFRDIFRKIADKEIEVNCSWFRDRCFGAEWHVLQ